MVIQSYDEICTAIKSAQTIAICGHVHPDGDSIGSVLALTNALRENGRQVTPFLADTGSVPAMYEFLTGADDLVPASVLPDITYDLFIALDTPNTIRLGDGAALLSCAKTTISIDHHPDSVDFADYSYCDPQAAAVGMLVWDLVIAMGATTPSPAVASCCYVALVTDTGRFMFQNTDARALRVASELCEAGAVPSLICSNIYQSRSVASVKLEARVMDRIQFALDGTVVYSWVSEQDFEECAATIEDGESLTDVVRSIAGADISLLLRVNANTIRASIRAKKDYDVGSVARALNGGGHRLAAGFTLEGTIEQVLERVLPLLKGLLDV